MRHNFRGWVRVNILAAIGPHGGFHTRFKASPHGFRQHDIAAFLRHLLRHEPGRLVVFLDGAAQHRGPRIDEVLQENPRLRIERLPPYAYMLNPTDGVFAHIKWHTLRNFTPYDTFEQQEGLRQAAGKLRRRADLVRACFFNSTLPRKDIELLTGHTGHP
jgi:putative transposase